MPAFSGIKQDYYYALFIQTSFKVNCGPVMGYQLQTRACLQLLIEANSFTSGHLTPQKTPHCVFLKLQKDLLQVLVYFECAILLLQQRSLPQRLLLGLDFSTF